VTRAAINVHRKDIEQPDEYDGFDDGVYDDDDDGGDYENDGQDEIDDEEENTDSGPRLDNPESLNSKNKSSLSKSALKAERKSTILNTSCATYAIAKSLAWTFGRVPCTQIVHQLECLFAETCINKWMKSRFASGSWGNMTCQLDGSKLGESSSILLPCHEKLG
jgi:hypothetical protein